MSKSDNDLQAEVENLRDEIKSKDDLISSLQNSVEGFKNSLDKVKRVISDYTRDYNGCREGKAEWLEATGLFTSDEIINVVGGYWTINGEITLTLPVTINVFEDSEDGALDMAYEELYVLAHRFLDRFSSSELSGAPDYETVIDRDSVTVSSEEK